MSPGKRFTIVAATTTVPLVILWTVSSKHVLMTIATALGVTLGPLSFFCIAMAVNVSIVQISLGRAIQQIKQSKS